MCPNSNTKIRVKAIASTRLSCQPSRPPHCRIPLVWWAPKGKGRKHAGYPGHPPLCVEIISVFRAPKTYASAKTTSSEHQKSLGESSGTSEKIILVRLWVWKCGLLPSMKGEWKLLFWEKPLGIRHAPWVRYRNKANCRCHGHRAVFALG